MTRTDEEPFTVVVRIASLLLTSSGEGVGTLERYVERVSRAFGVDADLFVLPDQVMVTGTQAGGAPRVVVLKATPGLSRLDQVMDLKALVSDIEAQQRSRAKSTCSPRRR